MTAVLLEKQLEIAFKYSGSIFDTKKSLEVNFLYKKVHPRSTEVNSTHHQRAIAQHDETHSDNSNTFSGLLSVAEDTSLDLYLADFHSPRRVRADVWWVAGFARGRIRLM